MAKTIRKKKQYTTKQKAALAAKIMQWAVVISETTPHDVFCDYSPHVGWLEVQIYLGGWVADKGYDDSFCLDFKYPELLDRCVKEVMEALDKLLLDA